MPPIMLEVDKVKKVFVFLEEAPLLVSQRDHWIHFHCPSRRDGTSQQCHES